MKKFTKLISLLCLAAAFVLASCSSPSSGTGGGRAQVSGKIGKYGAPYVVGDIVFNDGSATPYAEIDARTTNPKITTGEKDAAIAVIFYVGTGLNSDVNGVANTKTTRTLGVGLKHDRSGRAWCRKTSDDDKAKAHSINITTIKCTIDSGDKNGSDNLKQISDFLGTDDDTNNPDNYPAFQFGKEYSTEATARTAYDTSGWYLPSIAELYAIWEQKNTVEAASSLCGGSKFGSSNYWSSSQYDTQRDYLFVNAYGLDFSNGFLDGYDKDNDEIYVCAVRAFN